MRVGLDRLAPAVREELARLPRSLTILLDSWLCRGEDPVRAAQPFRDWLAGRKSAPVPFRPTRILMQDTAGVAALADLAALRDAVAERGGDPSSVEPAVPIDLVIDHSVQVDFTGIADARQRNELLEFQRNEERYAFFRWCEQAFSKLRIIPPGRGICHQVNLEDLATIARKNDEVPGLVVPEVVIGTDSHTTMINALGILGWGVGGLDAELVASGQPLMLPLPDVTQVELTGRPAPATGATDVALSLTRFLREAGVVGHVLEFAGEGLAALSLPDRAAIANMTPEFGATAGLFPADSETLRYLQSVGRGPKELAPNQAYAKATGLWDDGEADSRQYSRRLRFDLGAVVPVMAGPARPQDTVPLHDVPASIPVSGREADGAILIAAITSCTNTANPLLMLQAGLVAKRALERGLSPPPHVKCSLAPGSRRIARLLKASGLLEPLERIGFSLVGFGCTSCVGNSGPLNPAGEALLQREPDASVVSVLSGNRNFPNRIHPAIRANYLASPPLVVVAALAGALSVNLVADAIGTGRDGRPVHLAELWPAPGEAEALLADFERTMSDSADPPGTAWENLPMPRGERFAWDPDSPYIRRPPFLDAGTRASPAAGLTDAHVLLWLGDGVTTDHISPIGRIGWGSAAANYLQSRAGKEESFGSYGQFRGNHEVMLRGGFDHPSLGNRLSPDAPDRALDPKGGARTVYDAAMAWQARGVPLIVVAGRNYGCGSARDWAAKATALLGIRAVVAQSFERIHRSNLIATGVWPVICEAALDLAGVKAVSLEPAGGDIQFTLVLRKSAGSEERYPVYLAINSDFELQTLRAGGIFQQVLSGALSTRTGPTRTGPTRTDCEV